MRLYFAPMEGITGLVCRNAYEACFSGSIEKYFAPFITATVQKAVSAKELRDILPENNKVPYLVPQILANQPDAFIKTAEAITSLGYKEINLNLGCPSRTVVTKKKGAGFLEFPHQVDGFLSEVCEWTEKQGIRFSVKTRLGMSDEEEFWELLEVYNKYPLCELIVHPRLQEDYYVKPVHADVFKRSEKLSKNPLCYNGDIFDDGKLKKFAEANQEQTCVMIGRGFLMHPGMGRIVDESGQMPAVESAADVSGKVPAFVGADTEYPAVTKSEAVAHDDLWKFHDAVYEGYCDYIQGDKNMLFKMKELWSYMCVNFDDSDAQVKKALKQLRKSQSRADYEMAVRQLRRM